MRTPFYSKQFERDIKRMKKRNKDMKKLKDIISLLVENKKLLEKNRDHKLVGPFKSFRECHIEPDWLLIYQLQESEITLVRTGTHSDLFD